jgi:hypothetical protein
MSYWCRVTVGVEVNRRVTQISGIRTVRFAIHPDDGSLRT